MAKICSVVAVRIGIHNHKQNRKQLGIIQVQGLSPITGI